MCQFPSLAHPSVQIKLIAETRISMSYKDMTDSKGQPDGRVSTRTTWSRSHALATRRGTILGRTSENGVWVLTRRLVMVLFAMIWLLAGIYVSFTYLDVQYVPPVFFDGLERSGGEAAQDGIEVSRRIPNSRVRIERRHRAGAFANIIGPEFGTAGWIPKAALAVSFAPSRTTASPRITTAHDTVDEDETFTVALGTLPSGVTAGIPNSVQIGISDDEGIPTVRLSVQPKQVREGHDYGLTATLPNWPSSDVSIPVIVRPGTAEASNFGERFSDGRDLSLSLVSAWAETPPLAARLWEDGVTGHPPGASAARPGRVDTAMSGSSGTSRSPRLAARPSRIAR